MKSEGSASPLGYYTYPVGEFTFTIPERYQNLQWINRGAQGVVVSAEDSLKSNRKVAIKKFLHVFSTSRQAKHAYREFYYLRMVKHPNIIELLDAFTPQSEASSLDAVYLVMEYMPFTLVDLIKSGVSLSHKHLSFLMFQLLCGVCHLHACGIIHRDLKPSNMAVNHLCHLKILDFGLARSMRADFYMSEYVVTRHYRAPEVLLGQGYTAQVDLWAVGCILAELVVGRVFFSGTDPVDQMKQIFHLLGSPSDKFLECLPPVVLTLYQPIPSPTPWHILMPDEVFPDEEEDNLQQQHTGLTHENLRQLLSGLLTIDPEDRIPVQEALNCPYLNEWTLPKGDLDTDAVEPYTAVNNKEHSSIDDLDLLLPQWREKIFAELKLFESSLSSIEFSASTDANKSFETL